MPGNKQKMCYLTIVQKIELLKKLESGHSPRELRKFYNIGKATFYDMKKSKEKLLAFYAKIGSEKGLQERKRIRGAKCANLERVLYQWFKQRRSEGVTLTGTQICQKAEQFHKDLRIREPCMYSAGWLCNFKARHGICSFDGSLLDENHSAEAYISEFASLVEKEQLTPEQIYNADETGLYWRCVPRRNHDGKDENEVKVPEERVTVLACANAAGTHKCRLLLIGNSSCPLAVKGAKVLPLTYETDENSCITRELFTEWFDNHFVVEAREHCRKAGLPENCKILLLLDNCSAHLDATLFVSGNISTTFLPQNCTSIVQPMEQGVIRSMKNHYRKEMLHKLLNLPDNVRNSFREQYTMKDCIFAIAHAWDSVDKPTLRNAWLKLWPLSIFSDEEDADEDFEGFWTSSAREDAVELVKYAQTIGSEAANTLNEGNIIEWMTCDNDAPFVSSMTDAKIPVVKKSKHSADDHNDEDCEKERGRLRMDAGIKLTDQLIEFLKQKPLISQQALSSAYEIRETLIKEKQNYQKQITLEDSFAMPLRQRVARHDVRLQQASSETDASSSAVPDRDVSQQTNKVSKTSEDQPPPFHVVPRSMRKHDGSRETCPICPPLVSVLVLDDPSSV